MPTASLYSLSCHDSPGKGLVESAAARHLQMGFDGDPCPVLLWVPDWMVPQALKLGRNLQCFKPFRDALLATGKGPRDPYSYWAIVNSIVSIVYSPIYSTTKGHIIHTSWKNRGGEKQVEMSLQLSGFSLSLKDLVFSTAPEQAPRGRTAGAAGRTCCCQDGHQWGTPERDSPAWHVPWPLLSFRSELRLKSLFVCRDQTQNSDLAREPAATCFYLMPNICMH